MHDVKWSITHTPHTGVSRRGFLFPWRRRRTSTRCAPSCTPRRATRLPRPCSPLTARLSHTPASTLSVRASRFGPRESTILAVARYTTARTSYRRAAARLSTAAAHASRLCLLVPRRGDYTAGAQSSCRRRVDVSRAPADGVLGEPVAPRLLAHPEAAAAPPLPAPREREASEHTRSKKKLLHRHS